MSTKDTCREGIGHWSPLAKSLRIGATPSLMHGDATQNRKDQMHNVGGYEKGTRSVLRFLYFTWGISMNTCGLSKRKSSW